MWSTKPSSSSFSVSTYHGNRKNERHSVVKSGLEKNSNPMPSYLNGFRELIRVWHGVRFHSERLLCVCETLSCDGWGASGVAVMLTATVERRLAIISRNSTFSTSTCVCKNLQTSQIAGSLFNLWIWPLFSNLHPPRCSMRCQYRPHLYSMTVHIHECEVEMVRRREQHRRQPHGGTTYQYTERARAQTATAAQSRSNLSFYGCYNGEGGCQSRTWHKIIDTNRVECIRCSRVCNLSNSASLWRIVACARIRREVRCQMSETSSKQNHLESAF